MRCVRRRKAEKLVETLQRHGLCCETHGHADGIIPVGGDEHVDAGIVTLEHTRARPDQEPGQSADHLRRNALVDQCGQRAAAAVDWEHDGFILPHLRRYQTGQHPDEDILGRVRARHAQHGETQNDVGVVDRAVFGRDFLKFMR